MEVNCIIKEDGFLIEEGTATDPEDSLLELEDEIQSAQIQRPKDKPKERQVEQSLESQRKRREERLGRASWSKDVFEGAPQTGQLFIVECPWNHCFSPPKEIDTVVAIRSLLQRKKRDSKSLILRPSHRATKKQSWKLSLTNSMSCFRS